MKGLLFALFVEKQFIQEHKGESMNEEIEKKLSRIADYAFSIKNSSSHKHKNKTTKDTLATWILKEVREIKEIMKGKENT